MCCRALVFLCSHFDDAEGKRVFLWFYLKALIKTEKLEEARKVVTMHKISPEKDGEFISMLLELALLLKDFQALDDVLTYLVNSKSDREASDASYATLVGFLDRLVDVMDSDAVLKLVRHLMASTDPGSEALALLAKVAFNLTLAKFGNGQDDKDELLRSLFCLAKEAMDSLKSFGHAEWAVKIMWNLCLEVKSNAVRFWSLSVIRKLLRCDDELFLSCLLLQLSSAVALAEKGRPAYDVREEISKLLQEFDQNTSALLETTARQRRLVTVYRTKLVLLTEERFIDLAKAITTMMLDKGNDGKTLALMAGLMRRADPSRSAACSGVGYGKLVCRVLREAITRSGEDGASLDEIMEMFSDLIAYSAMNCSAFQV